MSADACSAACSSAIDMKLASSYVPAVTAMLKVLLLLAILTTMQRLGMPLNQSIISCAVCLYIDRNLSSYFIVDTNACALCTLISVAVNATRVGIQLDTTISNYIVSTLWCLAACCFVCDLQRSFSGLLPIFEISILVTGFFCGVHGFLSMPEEGDVFMYIRAMLFTCFTVSWVYAERMHQVRDRQHFSFAPCLDRFGLILLVQWNVVLIFSSVVLCILIWRQSRLYDKTQPTTDEEIKVQVIKVQTPHRNVASSIDAFETVAKPLNGLMRPMVHNASYEVTDAEEMDVYSAFQQAKENARKGDLRR
jgi:hypothetical protein